VLQSIIISSSSSSSRRMSHPPQLPQPPQPPPAPLPARDNVQATYAPLAEAGEYRSGAVLVAVAAPTPLPGRATPPTSPSDATSAEFSPTCAQGLPPGSGTVEYDINSVETIRLCDELGVEWCVDPDQPECQVGPLLMTDRGQLDLYVTDTVLMQKKRPALKSIARKLLVRSPLRGQVEEAVHNGHPHQPRPRVRQRDDGAGLDG
jgi:hypothetical protein